MKFRRALLEITNVCNLRCSFCAASARPPGFMSAAFFEKIARQAGELAPVISLHLLGEPFMHPDLPEILARASSLGLRLNLVTNGTLLGKFGPALFHERCLAQVSVSAQSLAALPQDERPAVLEAMISFARSRPPGLTASFRLRGAAGDPLQQQTRAAFLSAFPGALARGRGALSLAPNVFLNTGPLFEWRGGRPAGLGCLGLRHHFGVLYGGEVVPCCADYDGAMALGNVNAAPLRDLLRSPAALEMRRAIAGGLSMPAYCRGCGFLQPG